MNYQLSQIKNFNDLFRFAKQNGLESTAKLLRQWVLEGQPGCFCKGLSARAMCKVASNGIEGLDSPRSKNFYESRHGKNLYHYMLGNNESWNEDELSDEDFEAFEKSVANNSRS